MLEITKERFDELGLGCDKSACEFADECLDIKPYEIADCLDEERLKSEMTEEEYDAYRHGMLSVKED